MKTKNSFTIHTELISGTLSGARNIYMGANSTCHLYVVPREEISLANSLSDICGQPAFYILLGKPSGSKPRAYIGQTTDFSNRKNDHLQKKDWWEFALVFISDNHKIYGDDVKYLEYLGITKALEIDAYHLDNDANPKKPNIAPYRINDMDVFFRDVELLTRFYGCDIFSNTSKSSTKESLFFVRASDRPAHGVGYYDFSSKTFILKKGTIIANKVVDSYKAKKSRDAFIESKCKTIHGQIILQEDTPVSSPSCASGIVLGRPSNGWDDWKDNDGKKLGDVIKR